MLALLFWTMKPELLSKISSTAEMALSGGVRSVPLRPLSEGSSPFADDKHRRRFVAACHRAFEKAQNQIVSLLEGLAGQADGDDKDRTELIIRKMADGIAVQLLHYQTHIMRRFCIHPRAPGINLCTDSGKNMLLNGSKSVRPILGLSGNRMIQRGKRFCRRWIATSRSQRR